MEKVPELIVPEHKESKLTSKAREFADLARSVSGAVYKSVVLAAVLSLASLENNKFEHEGSEVERDRVTHIDDLPLEMQDIIEKLKYDSEIIITPQITLPEGDIVLQLAQLHSDPTVEHGQEPEENAKKNALECQRKISSFIEISQEDTSNSPFIYFAEGICKENLSWFENRSSALLNTVRSGENFSEIEKSIEGEIERFPDHDKKLSKYVLLNMVKKLAHKELELQHEVKGKVQYLNLINFLNERLSHFDNDELLYAGAMLKLYGEDKVQIHGTEEVSVIYEGLDLLTNRPEGVTDEVYKEMIRRNSELREDAVIKNIESFLNTQKSDIKRRVVVLPYGAIHDFHNNLQNKGMSLVRINMLPKESREEYHLKD